jgi:hypothetical protein
VGCDVMLSARPVLSLGLTWYTWGPIVGWHLLSILTSSLKPEAEGSFVKCLISCRIQLTIISASQGGGNSPLNGALKAKKEQKRSAFLWKFSVTGGT